MQRGGVDLGVFDLSVIRGSSDVWGVMTGSYDRARGLTADRIVQAKLPEHWLQNLLCDSLGIRELIF